jgi:multiple sugar transport system permease protein
MLYSLFLVTQEWSVLSPPEFVGLDNFRELFEDENIGISLWNTSYYTFLGVPLQLAVALALALALNQGIRGTGIYRTIFYLPSITPAVASAVVWMQILNTDYGVLNNFLSVFGIPRLKWLWDPQLAKPAFILMSLWSIGPAMVIFLAALQNVPTEMLEAAQIDGAGSWMRFWRITIPMISPVLLFNMIMSIIGSFQVFTASFVMTGGGPQKATMFTVLYIYTLGFRLFRMGFAATLSWVLFGIIMAFTVIQVRLSRQWVYYEMG